VTFVSVVVFVFVVYVLLRCWRKRRQDPPEFFPGVLRRRWTAWSPGFYTSPGHITPPPPAARSSRRNRPPGSRSPVPGLDRNTSIRSVMTLPEYRPVAAADRERTIGREGERAGIDVVIEFPETIEEEEERREDHMQALYEIRLARQLERAVQRESNATIANRQDRPISSTSSLLQTLQIAQERERRLSQVQYAEVGVARHDGTRVRPPSSDSDRPLLEASATMGSAGSIRSARDSGMSNTRSLTPECRRSEEIFRMGISQTVMEQQNSGLGVQDTISTQDSDVQNTQLLPPPPPSGDGNSNGNIDENSEWGPPPEYSDTAEIPVVRIDTGTPARTPSHSRTQSLSSAAR
jgi:hypothetical protein